MVISLNETLHNRIRVLPHLSQTYLCPLLELNVYLSSLGRLGEDIGIEKACNIINSFVARSSIIGKNVVAGLLSCYKDSADYLFTLQRAEDITLKLRSKGYADAEIISILRNLTQNNYNDLKDFWE